MPSIPPRTRSIPTLGLVQTPRQAIARRYSIKVCPHIDLKDGGRGAISIAKKLADLTDQIKRRTKFFAAGTPIVSSNQQRGRAAWTSARRPSMRPEHRDR